MTKLVTIGFPIYNRPIEMKRALDSVLNQSYLNIGSGKSKLVTNILYALEYNVSYKGHVKL
jgi:glycosyltransferase involved in cell wall biosynthesis